VNRLKELETENNRLRQAVSDLTLDKLIQAEAKETSSLFRRRACVDNVTVEFGVSDRRVPRTRSTSVGAAQGPNDAQCVDYRHHRTYSPWSLRISPDHGVASQNRLDGEQEAGGADLAV
jgi:hypothetical protein